MLSVEKIKQKIIEHCSNNGHNTDTCRIYIHGYISAMRDSEIITFGDWQDLMREYKLEIWPQP